MANKTAKPTAEPEIAAAKQVKEPAEDKPEPEPETTPEAEEETTETEKTNEAESTTADEVVVTEVPVAEVNGKSTEVDSTLKRKEIVTPVESEESPKRKKVDAEEKESDTAVEAEA